MSPRNEVFQAMPFDASSDSSELLIAAGDAEEEEDNRLQEKVVFHFKFSNGGSLAWDCLWVVLSWVVWLASV